MHHEELIDVRFQVDRGLAWIMTDRPECLNAFRARTVDQLIRAFKAAWVDSSVGVVAPTGAGDRAFCVGGDQLQRQETGDDGPSESGLFEIQALHRVVRDIPKPVIAWIGSMAWDTLDLFVRSAEAREGLAAFHDKRPPDFVPFRGAAAGQKPADQPVAP